jgi:hypothetical protein
MQNQSIGPFVRLAIGLICALTVAILPGHQERGDAGPGSVITGHVVDPHQLRPEEAVLMLGREQDDGSFVSIPISIGADGSFVTPRLRPGTYVLEIVRTPHSATKAASVVGFRIVAVGPSDVSGVMVEVRRDTVVTGRFRMESDNPSAEWPPHIGVNALLALDGEPLLTSTVAEGAPEGKFVFRNAFGPRVLRCGYTLAPGSRWRPSHVILDGRDITNVPTDFSQHENGQLEIVFTQHPACISGTVTDAQGRPVRAPWIMVTAADRALWQHWATTSDVAQGDTMGRFSIAAIPGQYRVHAVAQATFHSWSEARRGILRFASSGVPVSLEEREIKAVNLTLQER